jgi:hypothetical protein
MAEIISESDIPTDKELPSSSASDNEAQQPISQAYGKRMSFNFNSIS